MVCSYVWGELGYAVSFRRVRYSMVVVVAKLLKP